ncbi:MAG: hypothetical protein ACRDDZ_08740 [Marinifilaceae bacterium]
MTTVKNVNGTSRFKVPLDYNSWLHYWKSTSRQSHVYYCANRGCSNEAEVGAHVKKVYGNDDHYYIVPLCRVCNASIGNFQVTETLIPVPSKL